MEKVPGTIRILIVDNEPESTELQAILSPEGYRTETSADGPEAVARARRNPPDLIVLAMRTPDMDGLEVCRQLKADARTGHVPILLFTGPGSIRDKEEGLTAGADDYVTKPVDPLDVRMRVRSLIRISYLSQEFDQALACLQQFEAARRLEGNARGRPESAGAKRREAAPTNKAAANGAAPVVLLVDDHRLVRMMYGKLLEGVGYRVRTAASAAEAYAAAAHGVDVILLDVMMPGVSGLEALGRLRQITPDVPIIILTAYQTAQHAIAALRGGAFDFIVKGTRQEMLLNAVARAVERRRLAEENRQLAEVLTVF